MSIYQEFKKIPLIPYALLGILIINSGLLSYKYLKFYYFQNLEDLAALSACTGGCDAVMMSKYALLFKVPIPVYGFIAFNILLALFIRMHHMKDPLARKAFNFVLISCILAAITCLIILYFVLHLHCKFCMLSHITLFILSGYYIGAYQVSGQSQNQTFSD
jgi:uncharacterized membrane protein